MSDVAEVRFKQCENYMRAVAIKIQTCYGFDSEDLFQDFSLALVKACRQNPDMPEERFMHYMKRSIGNVIKDKLKSRRRRPESVDSEIVADRANVGEEVNYDAGISRIVGELEGLIKGSMPSTRKRLGMPSGSQAAAYSNTIKIVKRLSGPGKEKKDLCGRGVSDAMKIVGEIV